MNHKRSPKRKRFLFSLRFSILSLFISLLMLTTLAIIVIRSVGIFNEITYTSLAMMRYVSDAVLRELNGNIRPLEQAGRFSASLLQSGVLTEHEVQLIPYTYNQVKAMPLVRGAYWGDEQGNFVYSRKADDGTIISEFMSRSAQPNVHTIMYRDLQGNITKTVSSNSFSFDPRARPWYRLAKQNKKSIWTDVYIFYPDQGLGISTATPVLAADGHVRGVFGFDVSLENLKQFVEEQRVSPNGYSFIITRNENLIAYPQRLPFMLVSAQHDKLINVHQIGLPFIDKSIDIYKKTGQQALVINYQNNTYLITYRPVSELMPQGWLIGVVTPRSDLIGFLTRMNIITILVSLGILLIGIIIVSNLVSRIVRPINLLVLETDKIRQFELEGGDVKISSRIKEVILIRNAIRAMKRGLKQFQMFVPRTLVRQLIESGQEIGVGGERKQLVVLFSDIQNFTTIAERMDANALMEHICEYFELLSQIIIQDNGTIDKYIGDSVMAFWGAPIAEAEPWYHAAHAALQIQERMRELNTRWEKHGKPRLVTRIGIHMGDAIVGNLGSSERLNYTAIGDTVNITSRLEHINKTYKTKIIVSEAVYQLIKDRFVLRLVDTVIIKGRTETISVYELLGDDRSKLGFDIDAYAAVYERGFVAYKLKEWDKAINSFKECLKIYPEDKLALVFIHRCERRAHHDTE